MIGKLINFVIVIALVTLVITIFPSVYGILKDFIYWILSFGKWGVIILISACIMIITNLFR